MDSQSATPTYTFASAMALALEATFDGGRLTSDGGLPWLLEADRALGLCHALAACIPDWRRAHVQHSLETLVRQRLFQIACGYEDQNDATTLRHDPLLKLVCGRRPETGVPLASQPTLSRLENAGDRHTCRRLAHALLDLYLAARGQDEPPRRILLDLDGTDDPTYGQQEGTAYHANELVALVPLVALIGSIGAAPCGWLMTVLPELIGGLTAISVVLLDLIGNCDIDS